MASIGDYSREWALPQEESLISVKRYTSEHVEKVRACACLRGSIYN